MAERIPDQPVFTALYMPPAWPTLPEKGEGFASRAYLPTVGTVGYFVYTPSALGFYAMAAHDDGAAGVHAMIRDELAEKLAANATTTEARDAVLAIGFWDVEERVQLPDIYATIRTAWGM